MSETRSGVLPDHDIYLLDDELTEEQREVRDRVRAFVDAELMPVINDYWERAEFPRELVARLGELQGRVVHRPAHACPEEDPGDHEEVGDDLTKTSGREIRIQLHEPIRLLAVVATTRGHNGVPTARPRPERGRHRR